MDDFLGYEKKSNSLGMSSIALVFLVIVLVVVVAGFGAYEAINFTARSLTILTTSPTAQSSNSNFVSSSGSIVTVIHDGTTCTSMLPVYDNDTETATMLCHVASNYSISDQVLTVTLETVLVMPYTETCVTVSGTTESTYVEAPGGSTTVVTIYPTDVSNTSTVSYTTITASTVSASSRTYSTTNFSC